MHFNILTIFPEMFPGTLGGGVVGRALEHGVWSYKVVNIRDMCPYRNPQNTK
jgi:tRNA (guanine37-N1)-methyltransferase